MNKIKQTPEFTRAVSRLTCTDVFFTSLLYTLKLIPDAKAVEALTGGVGFTDSVRLVYHPERFAKTLNDKSRMWLVVHELLHVILMHPMRRGIREPGRWNVACDHVVNLLCGEYGFEVPKDRLQDSQYEGMTAEQVYDLLPQDEQGDGEQDVQDYDPADNDDKTQAEVEREIAINTATALQAAKAAGTDTAAMRRLVGEAQVQREPWYQHLRRYMTSMHARAYNWAKVDARRAVLHGIVSPMQRTETMGKIVFAVDESGSITDKQLAAMGAHIKDILNEVNPKEVVVMYFHSIVSHVDVFTDMGEFVLESHGTGGTCFEPIFEKVQEEHSDAQLVIILTDLYGSFPDGFDVCDTLWISQSEDVAVPFGEVIYADFNQS